MRPIYNKGQKPTDSVLNPSESNENRAKSFNDTKGLFEQTSDLNNNISTKKWNQTKKQLQPDPTLNKYTSVSPTAQESFYLPKYSVRAGLQSTFNHNSNSVLSDDSVLSPTTDADSGNDFSPILSNVDTTPLFSPSQILKLNRQRLARSLEEDTYQKLSHVKQNANGYDLNNNTENTENTEEAAPTTTTYETTTTSTKTMNPSKPPTEPVTIADEPIKMADKSETNINTSTTVFSYKKLTEPDGVTKPDQPPVVSTITSTETSPEPIKSKLNQQSESRFNSSGTGSSANGSLLIGSKEAYITSGDSYSPQYKSTISPRHTVVSRRMNSDRSMVNVSHSSYSNVNVNQSVCFSDSPISMRPAGAQQAASLALKESRLKEKQQLGELNDRFAGYVERVRFLEAQNKKLTMELDNLRSKWGSETKQIEHMYKIELEEARSVLNDTAKTKDCVQLVVSKQEQELDNIRQRFNEVAGVVNKEKERVAYLQEQISSNESEISLLRRRLQDLQDEEKRCKNEAFRMLNEIQRVSGELEVEMKSRLMLENDKQSLEEELIFLKEIHAREIEELKQVQFQSQGIDPAVFFKNELGHAIREIRDEYESLNVSQKAELEGWYRIKVSEIHRKNAHKALTTQESAISNEQTRKLKTQIQDYKRDSADLKARNADMESRIRDLEEEIRMESREGHDAISTKDSELLNLKQTLIGITNDYEELMLSKSDLESEIRTYRKLLEGEEEKDGLKQIVEGIEKRASHMSINNGTQSSSGTTRNLNRSYTVDTGYTSGATLNNTHTNTSSTQNTNSLNMTMPTKLFSNFAQKFETNCRKTMPNSGSRLSSTNKQFFNTTNPIVAHNSSIIGSPNTNPLDNSVISNSSNYSSLFSR